MGYNRVSVIEFGVAGGAGLLALERMTAAIAELLGVGVEVDGCDTGSGRPNPRDERTCPNPWAGGDYPMDQAQLKPELGRVHLQLGLAETAPALCRQVLPRVACFAVDLALYSSTSDALELLDAKQAARRPRIYCYFDEIIGYTYWS